MSAKREAFHLAGLLAFMGGGQLIAVAATGYWNQWLVAPFAVMTLAGFVIWMRWVVGLSSA